MSRSPPPKLPTNAPSLAWLGSFVLLALGALLCGCSPSGSAEQLTAREWRAWLLPPDGASLPTPRSVATGPRDEFAVLDTAGRVLIYNADGALLRQWKMLDVSVGKPEGLVILRDGRIVVCDTHYHRLVWFSADGKLLATAGSKGTAPGEFIYPVGVCTDLEENLYVCEYGGNDRIQKFTREGKWLAAFGSFGTGPQQFQRPSGLAWADGKLYVADAINHRVLVFSDCGEFLTLLGSRGKPLTLQLPYDIKYAPDGALYIIEYGAGRIARASPAGELLGHFGRTGGEEGEFATPWGLAVDSQLRVHVADTKNRRVVTVRF